MAESPFFPPGNFVGNMIMESAVEREIEAETRCNICKNLIMRIGER